MIYVRMQSVVVVLVLLVLAVTAHAQVDPGIVLEPWTPGAMAQTRDDAMVQNHGHVRDATAESYRIVSWDSTGRIRFNKEAEKPLTLGYRILWMDLDSDDPRLPARLTDQAAVLGFPVGQWQEWDVSLVLGAGYAGDNAFGDTSAIYGIGHLVLARQINEQDSMVVTLAYDGNRNLWPDIPLPAAYFQHVQEKLMYRLGLPMSQVIWEPIEKLTIDASYILPVTVAAKASYEWTEGFSTYIGYDTFYEGFHIDDFRDNERMFLQMRRAEAGIRWILGDMVDLTLAGGFAFDQKFSRGYDVRDLSTVLETSDEPYVRIQLRGAF